MVLMGRLLGSAAIGLALATMVTAPALADKISAAGKNPPINTSAPDNAPPAPPGSPASPDAVDFGDDTGQWARDGECDDPRFVGSGSAAELVDEDIRKDATDCRTAFEKGTVTLKDGPTAPADVAIASPVDAIDWGDDSSEYARDGECDDPRFTGRGMGAEPLESNMRKDAEDCRAAYEAGSVSLKDAATSPVYTPAPPTTPPAAAAAVDFGDDSSEWANDGECDDPRFHGTEMADELVDADLRKDATDCRQAYEAGTITLDPDYKGEGNADTAAIDYGDDASKWARDGECDDPRFSGSGVAGELVDEDRLHDATDCRAAVEAGTAVLDGDAASAQPAAAFDYGSDTSQWARDGECDDLRFEGTGVDKKLLSEDLSADASDCRAAVEAGTASIRPVYSPDYAAGAPYDSSGIDFGDNTSDYADDQACDDPRFEGPGAAAILLDDDIKRDSADCKAGFEAGRIVLKAGAQG